MSFIYIASPYYSPDPDIRTIRYLNVRRFTAWVLQQNISAYSPIVHNHPLAELLPPAIAHDGDFWQAIDTPILLRASAMWVLMLEGWTESKGIKWEMATAIKQGIPVRYVESNYDANSSVISCLNPSKSAKKNI